MSDVAIVGMACLFPGAADLAQFWRNLVGAVDAVGEPPAHWRPERYLDPGSGANDRIYTTRGGWLGDLATFDPLAHGVMPSSVDGGEPDQFLALAVADRALRDATGDAGPRDRSRTGVVVGHGTYVNRGFGNVLQHGLVIDQTLDLLRRLHPEHTEEELAELKAALKAQLPPFNPEMAPGLVPNVLTGRIANRLDLMGPNYTVDAACASSLVAVDQAVDALRAGRCDLMLAGGVHTSTTAPIVQIFCQLGAVSRQGAIRPFDERADGTLLGEGAGFVVLKRLPDAVADGDRVYAVLRSVGIASDGRASGLLAPRVAGEVLAIRRAYEAAGVDPATVGLLEAHGTGTDAGDEAELAALREVFGTAGPAGPTVALGSVKSMLAHLLPAAGIAGVVKTALALHHRVLPPTLHCEQPRPALREPTSRFFVDARPRPWVHGAPTPRRAGVNAFGFGGINAHALLEEAPAAARRAPSGSGWPRWSREVVVLGAADDTTLRASCARLRGRADQYADRGDADDRALVHLARRSWEELPDDAPRRVAVVASSPADLVDRLHRVEEALAGAGRTRLWDPAGTFLPARPLWSPGSVCFLFPGEGSPYSGMLGEAAMAFDQVRRWFDLVDSAFVDHPRGFPPSRAVFPPPGAVDEALLHRMDVGPESLFAASQGLLALLGALGVAPDAVLGHSSGEWSALLAAGCLPAEDEGTLVHSIGALNDLFEELRAAGELPEATLLAVGGIRRSRVEDVVRRSAGTLHLAVANCPHQAVLCGSAEAVDRAGSELGAAGAVCERLPFGRAYHTPLFAGFSSAVRGHLERIGLRAPDLPLFSCASAGRFPGDAAGVRDLAAAQWSRPVRFDDTVEQLHAAGARIFVEVGPAATLTAFVRDTLRGRPHVAVPTDQRDLGIAAVPLLVGQLFAHGVPLDPTVLFDGRTEPTDQGEAVRSAPPLATHLPILAAEQVPAAPHVHDTHEAHDARDAAMLEHLALMGRFLDVQGEVLRALHRPPAAGHPPYVDDVLDLDVPAAARVRCTWDVARHPALADHTLEHGPVSRDDPAAHGLAVVPLTMSLEAAAEAALVAAGGGVVTAVEEVAALRWTALETGRCPVLATARRTAPGVYDVSLAQEDLTDPGRSGDLLLTARVRVAGSRPVRPTPTLAPGTGVWPETELYGATGLFHGPAFRVVERLVSRDERSATAVLRAPGTAGASVLDTALLDGPGQVLAHWLAARTTRARDVFPVAIDAVELFAAPDTVPARHDCRVQVVHLDDDGLACDLEVVDDDGLVSTRMRGWRDVRLEAPAEVRAFLAAPLEHRLGTTWRPPGPPAGWATPVAGRRVVLPPELQQHGQVWLRALAHCVLAPEELDRWRTLPDPSARRTEWLAGRIAAKEAVRDLVLDDPGQEVALRDLVLGTGDDGAPVVVCFPELHVSLTHRDGEAVALASAAPVGVDLQPVGTVPDAAEVLAFDDGERLLLDGAGAGPRPALAARLWVAKEAAVKATGEGLPVRPAEVAVRPVGEGEPVVFRVRTAGAELETWTDVVGRTAYAACLAPGVVPTRGATR